MVSKRICIGPLTFCATEETDREAQAHMAIVFFAPKEIYCAALGTDSLSHTEPPHPISKEKSRSFKYLVLLLGYKRSLWLNGVGQV